MSVYADLSRHNGTVAWDKVPYPVILKLGGSDDGVYADSAYKGNATVARKLGKLAGAYWFNGLGAADSDAKFYLKSLVGYAAGDFVVLDVENRVGTTGTSWSPAKALAWFTVVKAAKPDAQLLVYMSESLEHEQDWSALVKAGVGLWVAFYGDKSDGSVPSRKPVLRHWPSWRLWQYSSTGTMPGVSGQVDLSLEAPKPKPVISVPQTPAEVKTVPAVSTIGSYVYSPKTPTALSTSEWTTIPVDPNGGFSFVHGFDGIVHVDFAFAIRALPVGATAQARIQILTFDAAGAVTGTAYSDVVELQGSGGTAFPSFGDTVVVTAAQRLRLVMLGQVPGVEVVRSAASVLRFRKG